MDKLTGILQTVIPVLVLISAGVFLKKKTILKREGVADLKTLTAKFFIPVVVFKAFYNASYSVDMLYIAAAVFAVCGAMFAAGFLINKAVGSKLKTLPYLMTGFEAGMLGYALYTLLFGADNLQYFATVDLGQVFFIFTIYISMLMFTVSNGKNKVTLPDVLKGMVRSPIFIMAAAGIAFGVSGLGRLIQASAAGGVLERVLDMLTAPVAAIVLIAVGYDLDMGKMDLRLTVITVLSRLALMCAFLAVILFGLGSLIKINEYLKWAFILMFLLPPPFIAVYVDDERENALLCPTLFIYTVITLAGFTAIAYAVA
jgi:predicted permease